MAILLELHNNTDSDVEIADLGTIVEASSFAPLGQFNRQDLSQSADLVDLVLHDTLSLVDSTSGSPMDTMTAIRDILTGGGHSVVNREGLMRVHSSPRPLRTLTYFTCAGDKVVAVDEHGMPTQWEIGAGDELLFNVESTDEKKSIDIMFSETIHIKDGYVKHNAAPLGAYIDFEVLHPITKQPLNKFCNKIFMQGDGWFELNSDDSAEMPYGLILRITVYNSNKDSSSSMKQSPATFQATVRLEMFRETTVDNPIEESKPL